MQEPEIKSVPIVVKFDDNFNENDDYPEDSVPLNNTTITTDNNNNGNNGMTLYYIGVEGSTKSTTIDPERSWALQIARVYGFPCTVGGGNSSSSNPFTQDRISEYKSLLKRFSFWVSMVNILMFIIALFCDSGFASLSDNVFLGPSAKGLSAAGAKYTYKITTEMQFWRLVTAVLHHYGLIHLAINLYAQLRLGVYAEVQWGLTTFALVYGASGLAGVLLSATFNPESISVGASGAMAGALAALLLYVHAVPEPRDPIRRPAIVQIGVLGVLYLVMSASGHVDLCAHIGGVLVGALLALGFWGGKLEFVASSSSEMFKRVFPVIMYALIALYFVCCLIVLYVFVYSEPLF